MALPTAGADVRFALRQIRRTPLFSGVFWDVQDTMLEDLDRIAEQCTSAKLDVLKPPTVEPWGMREMHLRHPDGHMFRVGSGISG